MDGRRYSHAIGAAFAVDDAYPVVYTRDGRRQMWERDVYGVYKPLAERDAELERLRRMIAERQEGRDA